MNYEDTKKREAELVTLIDITKKQIEQLVANLNMMMGAQSENKRLMDLLSASEAAPQPDAANDSSSV